MGAQEEVVDGVLELVAGVGRGMLLRHAPRPVEPAVVGRESLLDEAREQVVGGRGALAHDLGDLVGAHALGVRLEVVERLEHGARGRKSPPGPCVVHPRHAPLLSSRRRAPPSTPSTPGCAATALHGLLARHRSDTVGRAPRGGHRTEGDDAQPLAGDRRFNRACAAREGAPPCLGAVRRRRRRSPRQPRARADRGLMEALARGGRRPLPPGSAPLVADDDEAAARWEVHPLVTSAPLIRECMAGIADDAAHLMVISDADGTLLWLEGAPRVRLAAANSMNFAVGALWSEGGAGTNAIGTALAADHAVQVFAAEHFNEVVQQWTCAAAPVHDPETGAVLGHRRSHEPHEHRAPALVRSRRRDRGRRRGAPARVDARARPADALALPPPRRGGPRPARARDGERPRDRLPARRLDRRRAAVAAALGRRLHAALGRARVRRAAGPRGRLPRSTARARPGSHRRA